MIFTTILSSDNISDIRAYPNDTSNNDVWAFKYNTILDIANAITIG
jgi:hypothetical protein